MTPDARGTALSESRRGFDYLLISVPAMKRSKVWVPAPVLPQEVFKSLNCQGLSTPSVKQNLQWLSWRPPWGSGPAGCLQDGKENCRVQGTGEMKPFWEPSIFMTVPPLISHHWGIWAGVKCLLCTKKSCGLGKDVVRGRDSPPEGF